ncbi:hypothetical protein GCM10010255_59180 [Streptomyces coeruleofuscus]|uniref:Uncharacterized protein n=1 Tax=Streptomyces coeruleofuscus TaxID=66879 RepID=A0ABN3ITJ2_9ACTN
MSTEAQRASFPPRPSTPPRPSHPPTSPEDARTASSDAATGDNPSGEDERGRSGVCGPSAGTRRPSPDRDTNSSGSAAAGQETAARGGAAASGGADGSNGRPRFPSFGDTLARRTEPAAPRRTEPAAPRRTEPTAPPPPRASDRFPDTRPGVGRATRPESNRPSAPPDAPPRPRHLPTPGSSGRPGYAPTSRRTGAPAENSSETTARLRPVPADPSAAERAERPSSEPAESFGRPSPARPGVPPRPSREPRAGADADTAATTGRGMRMPSSPAPRPAPGRQPAQNPADVSPDPSLSWSAPLTPGPAPVGTRPVVSFGEPEGYDADARPRPLGRRGASQAAAAAVCLVLGLGLISGAVTGSWLLGDSGEEGSRTTFTAAGSLWHSVPVDQLFPPTVQGQGAGPGGADRTWTRIAVAPDSGCKDAFDPLLRKALAPVGCERLLRATYTDATESYVTTVGLLFTKADAAGMTSLANRFRKERLDRRSDLMPLPYAAKDTPAADFGAEQRAAWTVSVLTEAPVVVYAVSGWADGRTVDDPQPAEDAMESGATTAPAQAGLGNEAQGLADRVERGLRKNVRSATEQPS